MLDWHVCWVARRSDKGAGCRAAFTVLTLLMLAAIFAIPDSASAWFMNWRLTHDPAASFISPNNARSVTCDMAGVTHVVWYDNRDGNFEIYHARLDSLGWSAPERLTGNPSFSGDPAIAADSSGAVHLVWRDDRDGNFEIYYKTFNGVSWSLDERLTSDGALSWSPGIACDRSGNVHVVWHDTRDGDFEIYYKRFDGVRWSSDTRLTDQWGKSQYPSIAVDDSEHVHVVWQDYRDYCWDIYYKRYDGSWGADMNITQEGAALYPCVAADRQGRVHVVWDDHRDEVYDIYYKCFDGGWGVDERLTDVAASCRSPSVAADDSGGLHVVWQDYRHGEREIYYKSYSGSWGMDERLTDASGISADPSVAIDLMGEVHVVWHDYRDGNAEIYWNRSYDGAVPKPEIASIDPDSGGVYSQVQVADLAGASFVAPAQAWLQRSGQPDIAARGVQVVSEVSIVCTIDLPGAEAGLWDVVVQNPNGLMDTLTEGFEILCLGRPVIDSIAPVEWRTDDILCGAELWGSNLSDSVSIRLRKVGEADIVALIEDQASSERLTFSLGLGGAETGLWDVVVENMDSQKDTLVAGFEVLESLWEDETRLTYAINRSMLPRPNARCMAIDPSGDLHLVWHDNRAGNEDVYCRMFDGTSWGPEVPLVAGPGNAQFPAIAADNNGHLHVVWEDDRNGEGEIYYKRYEGTWTSAERLTVAASRSSHPSIATDASNTVHVVWQDDRDDPSDIYHKTYDGVTWSPDERLTYMVGSSILPAVEVDGSNNVHVVWLEYDLDHDDALSYMKFDGAIWSDPQSLATGLEMGPPSIAIDSLDNIHVAWHMTYMSGDEENIYYRKCSGYSWQPVERVTFGSAGSRSSSIVVSGSGEVFVVWCDDRHGDSEIYYKSFDNVLCEPDARLTEAAGLSEGPGTVVDGNGRLHVAWRDKRDGNYEIYYMSRAPNLDVSSVDEDHTAAIWPGSIEVFPNPVSRSTNVRFGLEVRAAPVISIYDVMGRLVWKRKTEVLPPGTHQVVWSGHDLAEKPVACGTYFVILRVHKRRSTAKIILVK